MSRRLQRLEALVVLAIVAAAFYPGLVRLPFSADESHWIGLSAPFEAFFTGRFHDPIWQERQDKIIIAPVTLYVTGAARRFGGYTPERLNLPYRFGRSQAENQAEGRVPEAGLLWWGRAGVTTAAVVGVFVFFVLLLRAAGRPAAYVWLALALANPYLRTTLRRAMNEGVLLAAVAVVVWAVYRALLRLDATTAGDRLDVRGTGWWLLAGAVAGLAAQTKLTGGLAVPAILIVIALAAVRAGGPWRRRARQASLAAVLVVAVSAVTFVGANPTLWPNPARATIEIVRARAQVIAAQRVDAPRDAMPSVPRRVLVASERICFDYGLLPGMLAGLPLLLAGALVTARQLYRWLLENGRNHALTALAVVGATLGAPAFLTPLDWRRYYLLAVVFAGFLTVIGVDWVARRLWRSVSPARAVR